MRNKLSATMACAIAEALDHGGELVLWRGGFWTYPNCAVKKTDPQGYRVPEWYVGTETLRALAKRGHVEWLERLPNCGMVCRGRVFAEPREVSHA